MLLSSVGSELVKLLANPEQYATSRLYRYSLGTGSADPQLTDTALAAHFFQKKIKSLRIDGSKLLARCEVRRTEGNSSPLPVREHGLKTANGTLVARDTHPAIQKSSMNRLFFVWMLDFTITENQFLSESTSVPEGEVIYLTTNVGQEVSLNIFTDAFPEYQGLLVVSKVNSGAIPVGVQTLTENGASITVSSNGDFTLATQGGYTTLAEGQSAEEVFKITIDRSGYLVDAYVTVTVNKQVTSGTGTSTATLTFSFTATATQSKSGTLFTSDVIQQYPGITVVSVGATNSSTGTSVPGSGGGAFSLSSNGGYTFNPSGDFDSLQVGFSETTSVPFSVQFTGGEGTGLLTMIVSQSQTVQSTEFSYSPPVGLNVELPYNEVSTFNVFDYVTCVDKTNLSVQSVGGSSSLVGTAVPSLFGEGGTFTISSNGQLVFNPGTHFLYLSALNHIGVTSPAFTISDGSSTLSASFSGTVVGSGVGYNLTNPVVVASSGVAQVTGSVLVNSSNPDGAPMTVTGVINSPNGDVQYMADEYVGVPIEASSTDFYRKGFFTIQSNGDFVFEPEGVFASLGVGVTVKNYVYFYVKHTGYPIVSRSTLTIEITKQ